MLLVKSMKRLMCLLMIAMLFGCAQQQVQPPVQDVVQPPVQEEVVVEEPVQDEENLAQEEVVEVAELQENITEPVQDDRLYDSLEECEAVADECVSLMAPESLTGKFVPVGSVKEGEAFNLPSGMLTPRHVCEEGLGPVTHIEMRDGECGGVPMCKCFICLKCGDGICGPGENYCNCNRDCFIKE
jgi:hypothetical protein